MGAADSFAHIFHSNDDDNLVQERIFSRNIEQNSHHRNASNNSSSSGSEHRALMCDDSGSGFVKETARKNPRNHWNEEDKYFRTRWVINVTIFFGAISTPIAIQFFLSPDIWSSCRR